MKEKYIQKEHSDSKFRIKVHKVKAQFAKTGNNLQEFVNVYLRKITSGIQVKQYSSGLAHENTRHLVGLRVILIDCIFLHFRE